jgi:hypothetical protein
LALGLRSGKVLGVPSSLVRMLFQHGQFGKIQHFHR